MKYTFSDDGAYIRIFSAETGLLAATVSERKSPELHEALCELLVDDANDCDPDDPALEDIIDLKLDIVIGLSRHMEAKGITKAQAGEMIGCSQPVLEVILRGDSSIRNLLRLCSALGAKVGVAIIGMDKK